MRPHLLLFLALACSSLVAPAEHTPGFDPQALLTDAASALAGVAHWRYQPYLLNGTPIEVETIISVKFVLRP